MSSSAGSVCEPSFVSRALLGMQDDVSVLPSPIEDTETISGNGAVIDYMISTTPDYRYGAMHSFERNVVLPLIGACKFF